MSRHYILNEEGFPVEEPILYKWAEFMEHFSKCQVGFEDRDGVQVSTMFLGLDHSFEDHGYPILWETMVFGGEHDHACERCGGNRGDAEKMHNSMVERIFVQKFEDTP